MTIYYWKVYHKPSGHFVIKGGGNSTIKTNRIGHKYKNGDALVRRFNSTHLKWVKGVITIKFEKEDFEIQQYTVKLTKTIQP